MSAQHKSGNFDPSPHRAGGEVLLQQLMAEADLSSRSRYAAEQIISTQAA